MKWFLACYLLVTGIGTLIVINAPGLVVAGFFLLIIPGLILSLLPTAFLYGVAFAVFWWPLQAMIGERTAGAVALVGAASVLWAIPAAANLIIDSRIAAERKGDKEASGVIPIKGVVRIERSDWTYESDESEAGQAWLAYMKAHRPGQAFDWSRRPIICDALCASALFTPGVRAVILVPVREDPDDGVKRDPPPRPVQFRIDQSGACATSADVGSPARAQLGEWKDGGALQASWRARISAGDCIVRETPNLVPDFTITAAQHFRPAKNPRTDWALIDHHRRVTRLAIRDRHRPLMQRTMVETVRLSAPLSVTTSGGIDNFRFQWARHSLSDGRQAGYFKPLELLATLTPLQLTVDPAAAGASARKQLAAVLDDASRPASDPAFGLPQAIFDDIYKNGLKSGDKELIAKAVGDPRTRNFWFIGQATSKMGDDVALLRAPIIKRLLSAKPIGDEAARALGKELRRMPRAAFATLTAREEALLADPERRWYAEGLIERQADRGRDAVPLLIQLIEEGFARMAADKRADSRDRHTVDAAQHALDVLGPTAAYIRPRLEAALANRDLGPNATKFQGWELTLVRLGRSAETIEKPSSVGGTVEEYHRRLRAQVARFERDLERDR